MQNMEGQMPFKLTDGSYEELEPSASLHNTLSKIIESRTDVRQVLRLSQEAARTILVESYLNFCQMARRCGDSNDLLVALAKTGFLELKYEASQDMAFIYPAVLSERAQILWKRGEHAEAVQTLRSLVKDSTHQALEFTLISKDTILAKLVYSFARMLHSNRTRVLGPRRCVLFRQI